MSLLQRAVAAAAAVAALVCASVAIELAAPSPAHASSTEVSMLIDDDQLIYATPDHMRATLGTLHTLGVDVVKVSMVWQLVAPDALSTHEPAGFDPTNPDDYPPGAWTRWDWLTEIAQSLGMKVYFLVIGPAPLWAVPHQNQTNQGPSVGYMPDPSQYQDFVQAVGERYSGTQVDPTDGLVIPRVSYWGIWNEPNERSWMNPWYRSLPHHRKQLLQPSDYRDLVRSAYTALAATGHAGDTIMVGETANRGVMDPLPFIRALYCVGSNLRPLRGSAASAFDCPTSGSNSQFVNANPGLFKASFAHHPYAFPYQTPPNQPYPYKTFITLYNVQSLERMLGGIMSAYGVRRPGGVPLYMTEWGYKTNPPNPYIHTSPALQATYLNEGEYMTWREPYLKGLTQFLLEDSPPKRGEPKGSALYWSTFQTGLEYQNSAPKPSFAAFRVPIWLPNPHHGRAVTVWGQLRVEDDNTPTQYGEIEFRRKGSGSWRELTEVQTSNSEGYFLTHVSIPSAGLVRLDRLDPGGTVQTSRSVAVS